MTYEKPFHEALRETMDSFVHAVYKATRKFPKDELYGVTSQIRRASLSVILNYIEGYARQKGKIYRHFLQISYGSLQEVKYLLEFSLKESYLLRNEYEFLLGSANKIGGMLWGVISKLGTHNS